MDKKDFTKPEMEIIDLGGEDIITTSDASITKGCPTGDGSPTTDESGTIWGD